jgi:hypothetical protein
MNTGARPQEWHSWVGQEIEISELCLKERFLGTDQGVMTYVLEPGEASWDDRDGIYSYRDHIRPRGSRAPLPAGARIVGFFGPYDQAAPRLQEKHPWIAEHWHE